MQKKEIETFVVASNAEESQGSGSTAHFKDPDPDSTSGSGLVRGHKHIKQRKEENPANKQISKQTHRKIE